jgi:hypothetical protein
MQIGKQHFTKHAQERSTSRSIPLGVSQLIVDYGEPAAARNGAQKYGLTKCSLRELRRDYGRDIADTLQRFRNAYVVVCDGIIVTSAFAKKPRIQ